MGSSPGESHEDRTLEAAGDNCPNPVIIGEVDPDLGGLLGAS